MIKNFLNKWSFFRLLRLGIAIAVVVQSIIAKDTLLAFMGVFLTAMVLFNNNCCGSKNCATPPETKKDASINDITYEKVV